MNVDWFPGPILLITLGGACFESLLTRLDSRRLASTTGVETATREYLLDAAHDHSIYLWTRTIVFCTFFVFGGFATIDFFSRAWAGSFGWGETATGILFFLLLGILGQLLSLPFAIRHTFGLETRHGFNRTTLRTFVADRLKSYLLVLILGIPIGACVLALLQHSFFMAWLVWTAIELGLAWLMPVIFLPMFAKLTPLPPGALADRISGLAARLAFPFSRVYLMDGSRRSSRANAFFAGFGPTRKIVLFDTLVARLSEDEIVAVLAHEIGHWKRKHVLRRLALGLSLSFAGFSAAALLWQEPTVSAALGLEKPHLHTALLSLSFLARPFSAAVGFLSSWLSRKHEYEADAFARDALNGNARPLVTALTSLAQDHKAHPDPHPIRVALAYSHPTLLQRRTALSGPGIASVD